MWKPRLFYLVGCWILVIAALQVLPVFYAITLSEKASFHGFFASFFSAALIGGSLVLGFRDTEKIRVRKLTILLPVFGITAMGFFAGLPFFFLMPDSGLFAAFYDGVSLITTNGSSAYEGVQFIENLKTVQLWRAIAAWAGGYLAICLALSLLSAMNIGGLQLHQSPMPFGDSEVGYARLKATVNAMYPVYIFITLMCTLLMWLSGAGSLLSSLQMAMVTVSGTGLTSVYGQSLSSFPVQVVTALFLVIGMLNWDMHYMRYMRRSLRYGNEIEYKNLLFSICAGAIIITFIATHLDALSIWRSFFAVISAASTSGISTPDMLSSDFYSLPVAIILMAFAAIGGAVISPTGGLKQMRLIVIFKTGKAEVERLAHPHAVAGIHYDNEPARKRDIEAVWLLLGSFVLMIAIGALALAVLGIHFQDALSMAFTSMTLSGPLITFADPTFGGYAGLNVSDYLVLVFLMVTGRIEASIILALFLKTLWRG